MKSLYDILQESLVTEMADDISKYRDKIESQAEQLLENWCLVWYCDNYDKNNINRNHWASEFLAAAKKICTVKIKVRNRKKIIESIFKKSYELYDVLTVIDWLKRKMEKEHLNEYIGDMSKAFTKNLDEIIDVLAGNYNDAIDYIKYPIGY